MVVSRMTITWARQRAAMDAATTLDIFNSHAEQAVEVKINLLGGAPATSSSAQGLIGKIHAHNRFDQPDANQPQPFTPPASGSLFTLILPAASVLALQIELG